MSLGRVAAICAGAVALPVVLIGTTIILGRSLFWLYDQVIAAWPWIGSAGWVAVLIVGGLVLSGAMATAEWYDARQARRAGR